MPEFIPIEKGLDNVLVFPIGKFIRGGEQREFTVADAVEMVRNFGNNILERDVPVNKEHDRPEGRVGKVLRLWVAEDGVRGKLDSDDTAKQFGYVSPEVRWEWQHPHSGEMYKNVLMGLALTNYPYFLGKMNLWSDGNWEAYTEKNLIMLGDITPNFLMQRSIQELHELDKWLHLLWKHSDDDVKERIEIAHAIVAQSMIKQNLEHNTPLEYEQKQEQPSGDIVLPYDVVLRQRQPFVHEAPVAQIDEVQRIAYGVVLQPDVPDGQGHVMEASEIEAACHRYMESAQALDEHHVRETGNDEVKIVECWIQREPVVWKYGEQETNVLPGSWCMAVKFYSDELWGQVASGEITGFSPKGWGMLIPVASGG